MFSGRSHTIEHRRAKLRVQLQACVELCDSAFQSRWPHLLLQHSAHRLHNGALLHSAGSHSRQQRPGRTHPRSTLTAGRRLDFYAWHGHGLADMQQHLSHCSWRVQRPHSQSLSSCMCKGTQISDGCPPPYVKTGSPHATHAHQHVQYMMKSWQRAPLAELKDVLMLGHTCRGSSCAAKSASGPQSPCARVSCASALLHTG